MSRLEILKLRRKRILSEEEFRRAYKDGYDYLRSKRANRNFLKICRRLQEDGKCLFPEVTLRQAAFLTGLPEGEMLFAMRNQNLSGRVVWGDHFIPLIDLWIFYRRYRKNRI